MVSRRNTRTRAKWTTEDEMALVQFLSEYKTQVRDTNQFLSQKPTWDAAAAKMKHYRTQGGTKSPMACKAKWQQLKKTFRVVDAIVHRFPFSWNDKLGANIDTRLQDIWLAYIQEHPEAKPFRNTGWPHYVQMRGMMSSAHQESDNGTGESGDDVVGIARDHRASYVPCSGSDSESSDEYDEDEALLLAGQAAYLAVMAAVQFSQIEGIIIDHIVGEYGDTSQHSSIQL